MYDTVQQNYSLYLNSACMIVCILLCVLACGSWPCIYFDEVLKISIEIFLFFFFFWWNHKAYKYINSQKI